ncbi:hypothetical protein [Streptomyces sp. YS415]|uniref:hypothetical protein n=1 Tax=Streptomyces sp. YS415 TaxID=2944806 RepID=UPI002021C296|nr:hypothetical protein [Streptomyces sp. YS415]MCL7426152.1 hypothetical protein [Streptomyces sp. YS415]
MNREPVADRRQLLDTLQGLLDALPRPADGPPLRADDVLAYLETGRGREPGAVTVRPATTPDGDAAVEASLRLVIEAFTALLSVREDPAGPR